MMKRNGGRLSARLEAAEKALGKREPGKLLICLDWDAPARCYVDGAPVTHAALVDAAGALSTIEVRWEDGNE